MIATTKVQFTSSQPLEIRKDVEHLPFGPFVIPAKAGIYFPPKWIPYQVRNERKNCVFRSIETGFTNTFLYTIRLQPNYLFKVTLIFAR